MKIYQPMFLGLLMLGACSGDKKTEEAPLVRSVRYIVAKKGDDIRTRTFSGSLRAGSESRLSFQVAGRLQQLNVKLGQKVAANEVIAKIDPADFELQIREARASAAQAMAQSTAAEASYQRVRKLYETKNAARQDLDSARAQRDGAQSAVSAVRQSIRRLERQLGYATLRAPAAGAINQIAVEVDEVVGVGSPVVTLLVGEQLEIGIEVPESLVSRVEVGGDAVVLVAANNDLEIPAKIEEVGAPVSGGGGFPVTVRLLDRPAGIRQGMVGDVRLEFSGAEDEPEGFKVPLSAVSEDREGRFVYLAEPKGEGMATVARRAVETGEIDSSGITIKSGLEEGLFVITAGVSRINEGLVVKFPKAPTP